MMTAPLPPAKMAPVMAKKRKMYSLCWKSRLKTKLKTATPRIESEDPEVLLRREGLLPEGHDDVLDEDAAPGVEIGLVAADRGGEHDRGEGAHEPDRQELGQGDRHGQLAPQGVRPQAVEDGPDRGGRRGETRAVENV